MSERTREVDLRPFPMQDGPPIPWFLAEAIYEHVYRFGGQTLERLAERGGFGWGEVKDLWVDRNRQWRTTDAHRAAARQQVLDALAVLAPPSSPVEPEAGDGVRRWFVYSDEDDGENVLAPTGREAAERWMRRQTAQEFHDVHDGTEIYAQPSDATERFEVAQTNPEYSNDVEGAEPTYALKPPSVGDGTRGEER